mgnify:CR=1 FL=1
MPRLRQQNKSTDTGLEPTRRKTLDPKSSAATNYATSANDGTNIREVYKLYNY